MEVSRRQLFKLGTGALLTAAHAPLVLSLPVLWGDGKHDDTESVSAILNGRPVRFANPSLEAANAVGGLLTGGVYLLTDTIRVSKRAVHIEGAVFDFKLPHKKDAFVLDDCPKMFFQNMHFKFNWPAEPSEHLYHFHGDVAA